MTPELILGSPGCGKTTALLAIVDEELTNGTRPDRIGYVSFTKRAAEEAVTRACTKFNLHVDDLPWFRTLHSLAYRCLGMRRDDVLAGDMMREFAVYAGIQLSGKKSDDGLLEGFTVGDRIMHMEHLARVKQIPLRDLFNKCDDDLSWSEVDRVERYLRTYKKARKVLDYTDMLTEFVDHGNPPMLDILLVDECQDLSKIQWLVVAKLSTNCRRVVYSGDDDQCIYSWAGATQDALVDVDANRRVLNQSYRVPKLIQDLATGIISKVHKRNAKTWSPRPEDGGVHRVNDLSQAAIETGEVLVLARNSYIVVDQIIPELRRRGVYYSYNGRPGINEGILRDIQLWEKLRGGAALQVEDARAVVGRMSNRHCDNVGRDRLTALDATETIALPELTKRYGVKVETIWHEALDRIPRVEVEFMLAARRRGERLTGAPRVRVSTIHGSKGGEAPHVVLMTECAKRTMQEAERWPDDERRVQYVGVTRAQSRLTIVGTNSPNYFDL